VDQPSTPASTPPPAAPVHTQTTWNDSFNQLDGQLERLRVQVPAAPPGLLDGYMRFAPWIAIIFGCLGFLGLLALTGVAAVLSPFLLLGGAEGVSAGGGLFLALAFGLVTSALEVVGGYLMLQRRATGWWILAAGLVVSALNSLFHAGILTLIVLVLIAYIHLQVKPNYHN
jgi:hypothetical protein